MAAWDRRRGLTYAELDALVGALALRIVERRTALGSCGVIPLVAHRDLGSVLAVNACIRAAVPFAALDPDLPPGAMLALWRRLDDPGVAVIGDDACAATLPPGVRAISAFQLLDDAIAPQPVDPDTLARLVFTSGSTGAPKGVMTSWAWLDSFLDDPLFTPPPGVDDDRALNVAPISFAAGAGAAMRPALGTAVTFLDPNDLDPVELLEFCDRHRLGTLAVVPSHVATVLDRWPSGRRLESVRSMMAYGEALEWQMVPTMRRLMPDSGVIVNAYGTTEAPVAVGLRIDSTMPLGVGRVPLGRPMFPDRVRLEPMSGSSGDPGEPLEVVMCGPRLAMGYWRDEQLTAACFGTDPAGTRVWRSGDLVRVDEDGMLHFVGRADNVVKINGKLVEPSEPERVLASIPGVDRAVVLVQERSRGGHRLVAHVQVAPDATVGAADVRRAVVAEVAPHLVPAVIVRHESLPITDRGKVDRQALKTADPVPWRDGVSDRAPSLNEAAVLAVAAEVLGFDDVGPDDDLWDLGLDSLGATEVLATLTDFGWEALPESVLLEHRTAAAIASLRGQFVPTGDAIWLNTEGSGPSVACVLGPSSDALTFRRLAQELAPDHQVGILRQFDPASTADVPHTVPDIAAGVRRSAERGLAAGGRTGRPAVVVGYSGSGVVAYDLGRQLAADGVVVHVVLIDAPAGARTAVDHSHDGTGNDVAARLRRSARQALVRALPAGVLPQKERAYARFDRAGKAAQEYRPPVTDLPVTLFRAVGSGLPDLADAWTGTTPHLTVIDLDCDHDSILGMPYVGVIAEHVRTCAPTER